MKTDEPLNRPAESPGAKELEPSDWREYYHAARERFWIILLCTVLGGIGAAIYMNRQEAKYQARAVLFLEQEQDKVLKDVKGVREEQIASLDMINTVVDMLRSYPFAQRVVTRTKLNEDPRFLAVARPGGVGELSPQDAAGKLVKMVSAQFRRGTRLIDIFVTHQDPALATSLANAYSDEYLQAVMEKRTEASRGAQKFLLEESERLRKKMQVSEEAMQSFREKERASSIENLQETAQAKLTELTTRLDEIEQKLYQLDTDLKVARANVGKPDELLRLPSVAAEPKVARLTDAIAAQEREILLLSQRYRAKHPASIAARTQRDSLIAERNNVLANAISLLETGRQHLQAQFEEEKKAREEQESRLLAITGKSVPYNVLKRELETDSAMLQSVTGRIKEIDVTKGLTDSPVRVHERALGAAPVGVSANKVYSSGIFLGLAAGLGIVFGLHAIDNTIKTVEQAEQFSGVPVLAAVPRKKGAKENGGKQNGGKRTLDAIADRHGMIAESFRSLRASMTMLSNSDTRRSFLFTSPQPSEGKTFCSTNFAVTLSQQGFKTLLIDADLRKPMVSVAFFGENRKPGLSDVLSGQTTLQEAAMDTGVENLVVLTAGTRAPNPAELIATPKMRELLDYALTVYDRVVVDTAPVLAVSDTLLIAPHVQTSCLVIRACSTPRKTAARAVKALADVKCRPAGIVLNFLPSGFGSYYYYYSGRYYGSYHSKGVYGAPA